MSFRHALCTLGVTITMLSATKCKTEKETENLLLLFISFHQMLVTFITQQNKTSLFKSSFSFTPFLLSLSFQKLFYTQNEIFVFFLLFYLLHLTLTLIFFRERFYRFILTIDVKKMCIWLIFDCTFSIIVVVIVFCLSIRKTVLSFYYFATNNAYDSID